MTLISLRPKFSNLNPIILASASPRRQDILKQKQINFITATHHFDEASIKSTDFKTPRLYVKHLAQQKAYCVKNTNNLWVLTADTIVTYQDTIFEKPKNLDDALSMLLYLQNKTHQIFTAFCLFNKALNKSYLRCCKSDITFKDNSPALVQDYIYTYKPLDKSGSYGIQELPKDIKYTLKGSFKNVMGLPITDVIRLIKYIQ